MKGDAIGKAEKAEIVKKVARFTGLGEDYLDKANLRLRLFQLMQELQRNRGLTTSRLDARFAGPTYNLIGEAADYDPQDTAISGAFVGALNTYIREERKFGQDKKYKPAQTLTEIAGTGSTRATIWLFPRLPKRRAGPGASPDFQSVPESGSRRRYLRSGNTVYGSGIHGRPHGLAGKHPKEHLAPVLRSGPHDVPA